MKRTKKLCIMLGVLGAILLMTLCIGMVQEKQENIEINGETILSVPVEEVTAFSWTEGDWQLAFRKEGGRWIYQEDEHFPASTEKVENLLRQFESFGAGFTIEDVEDPGVYGLADPAATLVLETGEETYTMELGDYSKVDEQRYVSIGDGKVYLAAHDPWSDFTDTTLRELILQDEIPAFGDRVEKLTFRGEENYEITREENGPSYRKDDIWYTEREGEKLPLNPALVEDYLAQLNSGILYNYADYYVTEEELASYGMDAPELTVTVSYEQEDAPAEFTIHLSRDPAAVAEWEALSQAEQEEADPVPAFARVEGSDIVYRLDSTDYRQLARYTVDELRYREVLPAQVTDIREINFELDDGSCHLTAQYENGEQRWFRDGAETEGSKLADALSDLRITEFKAEQPSDKLEVSFAAVLNLEGEPEVTVELYRYDGTSCLVVVDGSPLGLVSREDTVALKEAVNGIMLARAE